MWQGWTAAAAAVVAAALCACGGPETASGLGALDLEGDSARGAALFASRCAVCHGDDGSGGSQGVDIADHVPFHSDEDLVELLAEGEGRMPAPGLSDQEIADVLAYLRATFTR